MDISNKNAVESLLVSKFLYYSHILLCLVNCHPAMLEFFFSVHVAYSYHDLWSLCSRPLCRAFAKLKSTSSTPHAMVLDCCVRPCCLVCCSVW